MAKPFKRNDAFIAPTPSYVGFDPPMGYSPAPTAGDIDSACQRATANGIIGAVAEAAGVDAGGAVIGGVTQAAFHTSIG